MGETIKMNEAIKTQWVKDLHDPNRKQGVGHLRNAQDGQCCLDVLVEQAVKAGVIDPPELDESLGVYVYHYTTEESSILPREESELLPQPVMDWAGLVHHDPYITDYLNPHYTEDPEIPDAEEDNYGEPKFADNTLSSMNDEEHLTFAEIADIIEQSDL